MAQTDTANAVTSLVASPVSEAGRDQVLGVAQHHVLARHAHGDEQLDGAGALLFGEQAHGQRRQRQVVEQRHDGTEAGPRDALVVLKPRCRIRVCGTREAPLD